MPAQLPLHKEVILLALRDSQGTFSAGMYLYSVAGAMLSELLLQQRIVANDDKPQTVAVVDTSKTGCAILDELLLEIDGSQKHKGLQQWVIRAARKSNLNHRIAESLCNQGILENSTGKFLFLFTRQIYPEIDGSFEDEIRRRMASVMFDPTAKSDERTGVLVAFANLGNLLAPNFAPDELSQHAQRISEITAGQHLAAGATQSAIQAIQTAIQLATIATTAATTAAIINN